MKYSTQQLRQKALRAIEKGRAEKEMEGRELFQMRMQRVY
jgi:hypothetical protein